jgi:hypothetical protein
VTLSAGWSFFILYWVAPSHCVGIEHIKVIARYDLLERLSSSIIASKQIYFVTDQVCCMASKTFWRAAEDLRFGPGQCLCIEDMKILEVLVSRMTAK